jgi:glycosyltransferase involved in cell wall biosynthesis
MKEWKSKLRIAMLGQKRIPSREGGVEIVVEELATKMVERGHSVTCYNRSGHHVSGAEFDQEKRGSYRGVKLKYVWTLNKKGLAAMTASVSAAICAALGPYDVVHFHAEGPCAMLWLPKLFGKRCIATVHGLDHRCTKWGRFARAYILWGEKCAVKFADEIIVLNADTQNYFMSKYGRATRFIPNGVHRPEVVPAEQITQLYGLEERKYILFLGRIVPGKGLELLIQAFKNVKTEKRLIIAGGSSDTDEYMAELKKSAESDSRIRFIGFVQGQILEELYSNSYLYVLPTEREGMPLSLLEAMSYGNCCLVSDIPECTEVVENHAVLFQKGNADSLQMKLQQLCDDEARVDSYRANAAQFICSKYVWDDVVDRTLEAYYAHGVAKSDDVMAAKVE